MKNKNPHLLPSGLYDLLPPEARKESEATARLLDCFASFGYEQVSPPLLEFEASLLSGRGEALSAQTFRVMDPASQAMMGFRADITYQVARIASSRLATMTRPLRLCYAGPILRIKAEALMNERQLTQAGIELIGADSWAADAEVMTVAAEALRLLGIEGISIDINLPGLLGELCPEAQEDATLRATVKDAVQRRDVKKIAALPVKNNQLLARLAEVAGPVSNAVAQLKKLGLGQAVTLENIADRFERDCPQTAVTCDPLEYRGFDYHFGVGFSIFARNLRHELGRGGHYKTERENATGFTLYVTHLLELLEAGPEKKRILIPSDISPDAARKLRAEGWAAIIAVTGDMRAEAARLGVKNIWADGKISKI